MKSQSSAARMTPADLNVQGWLNISDAARLSEIQLAQAVANGLSIKSLGTMQKTFGKKFVVGKGALVSESTVSRRKHDAGTLDEDVSERLYGMARVLAALSKTYHGNTELIGRFLHTANPVLEGHIPYDLARSSVAGADVVLRHIKRLDAGVAA